MKYLKQLVTLLSIVSLLIRLPAAYGQGNPKLPPPEVDVYKVKVIEKLPVTLIYPARLKSPQQVTVVARVTGFLERKFFKEGDYVKKGQLLYLIEPDPYEAAYERAKANLLHAQAQLEKAERDWKRAERSFKAKAISEQARDAAKYAYEMAKAQVLAAKAALKQATINLGYTKVRATISGYTGLKQIDVGNLVTPGTPLVTITSVDPIYVEFSIPDVDVFKSKYNLLKGKWGEEEKKLKAKLLVNNVPYNLEGKVHFLDVKVNPNTSTVKARAVFPNPNRVLMPGQFGRVEISGLYRRNVIVVPQKAVLQTPRGSMVYVVQNGRVAPRIIKVGETSGDYFVVESGLKPGELVVVNNFFKIKPGIPVKIGEVINGRGER